MWLGVATLVTTKREKKRLVLDSSFFLFLAPLPCVSSLAFFAVASEQHHRPGQSSPDFPFIAPIPMQAALVASSSSAVSSAAAAGPRIRGPALAPSRRQQQQQQSRPVSVAALRDPVVIPSEFTKVRKTRKQRLNWRFFEETLLEILGRNRKKKKNKKLDLNKLFFPPPPR